MATTNTVTQLNGIYKEVYASKLNDLTPDGFKLLNLIEFSNSERIGANYHQPVILSHEHGFTYGGSAGDAFALNEAVAAANKDAQVSGYEMVLRSYLSIGAISRSIAGKSGEALKSSFVSASKLRVENMHKSFMKRLEVQLLRGQMGLGTVSSVSGNVLTMRAFDWAPGIWAGAEGMIVEIRNSTGSSGVAGAPSTTLRGSATISSVDLTARTITLDAAPAGVVDSDMVLYKGSYGNEFAGLHKIITNTGSLFGISAATYTLWSGNTVSAGTDATTNAATLTFAKVEEAIAKGMEKGLDEDVVCLVNPNSWNNLLSEQASKRSYDQSYSSASVETGAKSIKFHSQVGLIEIVASIYCSEGFAYVFPKKDLKRIGSRDVSFDMPGFEDQFIKLMENANAFEIRAYSDQALFTSFPGKCTIIRYVKN